MTTAHLEESLSSAIASARSGDKLTARHLLRRIVQQRPSNAHAWVWLAYAAESVEEKRAALRTAMRLQPDNQRLHEAFMDTLAPANIKAAAARGVFISYARSDEVLAVELARDLYEAGISAWLDIQDISEDGDWHGEITNALHRCGVMVLVASPNVIEDTDSAAERLQFLKQGKIIIPAMHETCDLTTLDIKHPAVDFRRDYALGLHRLLGLLQK